MAAALERALGPAAAAGSGSGAALPPLPVLLTGPAGSGRTSLLLRAALAGGADGPRALFLAPSAIPRLPGGSGGTGTDPRALQRLELRYPRTRLSLCRELLSLSLSLSPSLSPLSPPPVVLLDGLERYLCPLSPSATARLAALLLELSLSPSVPSRPQLVASLRLPPPGGAVTLGTLLRFFPARCHLRGDTRGRGHVWVTLRCPGTPTRRWRALKSPSNSRSGPGTGGHSLARRVLGDPKIITQGPLTVFGGPPGGLRLSWKMRLEWRCAQVCPGTPRAAPAEPPPQP